MAVRTGLELSSPPQHHPLGVLATKGTWFDLPGLIPCLRPSSLLLVNTQHVPIDFTRTHFDLDSMIWRPDDIEAIRSFVHATCLYGNKGSREANAQISVWLYEFVVYVLCGVKSIKKSEIEGQV